MDREEVGFRCFRQYCIAYFRVLFQFFPFTFLLSIGPVTRSHHNMHRDKLLVYVGICCKTIVFARFARLS